MMTIREGYQAANQEDDSSQEDYGAVYGVNVAGHDFSDPEMSSGWTYEGGGGNEQPAASPVKQLSLGPLYNYDSSGKKVYQDPEVASGWTYGGNATVTTGPATAQTGAANSAANYPAKGRDVSWATPFNKAQTATGTGQATGLKSGITTSQKPYATVTSSKTVFPTGSQYPTFKGPTWNEREIAKKAAKIAAPGISALEMKVSQAMARYYENPNVRRMVLRDTLAGYGIGLSNIRAGAARTAQAEYGQEYARMYSEAMGDFQRALGKLQTQATHVSSQKQVMTEAGYNKLMGEPENLDTLA